MKRNWIGIDAHKEYCETAVLNDKGTLIKRINILTNEKDIVEAILKIKGERYIVIEESSIAHWLYLTLKPYANKIVICDPKVNKWIHADEIKNCKVDCFKLADLYRMGRISEVYHTDVEDLYIIGRLVTHYDRLIQNSTRAMNRIKAQYSSIGMFVKGTGVYNPAKKDNYLKKVASHELQQVINNYGEQLNLYRKQQRDIVMKLRDMSKKYPCIKKIRTIPGLGFIRTITIFAIVMTPDRFKSKSKRNRYAGLSTVAKGSGGKVYKSYASRGGNHMLKNVLLDAATTCIHRYKDNYFGGRYKEHLKRGLSEQAAKRTIAREIFHTAIGVWKSNTKFSPDIHNEHRRRMSMS
jgi:transposase